MLSARFPEFEKHFEIAPKIILALDSVQRNLAFNTLRECIEAHLLLAYTCGNATQLTRIADHGRSKHEVANRMTMLLSNAMH